MSKRKIKGKYETLGGRIYDLRYRNEQISKYSKVLANIKPKEDHIILDNGCGTGLFLEKINAFNVGIDISSRLLTTAIKKLDDNNFLIQGDSEKLPFRSDIFNFVFSFTVIQNLHNIIGALKEIKRVSTKNGKICVSILKKAVTKNFFIKYLIDAKLNKFEILKNDSLNDWIALINK